MIRGSIQKHDQADLPGAALKGLSGSTPQMPVSTGSTWNGDGDLLGIEPLAWHGRQMLLPTRNWLLKERA